jgi:hypothetical protein
VNYDDLPEELDRLFPPVDKFWVPQDVRTYMNAGWVKASSFLRQQIITEMRRIPDPYVRVLFVVEEVTRILCKNPDIKKPMK